MSFRPEESGLAQLTALLALVLCPIFTEAVRAQNCPEVAAAVRVVDKCSREALSSASDIVLRRGNEVLETVDPEDPDSTIVCCPPGSRLRVEPLDKNYYASPWERCRERIEFEVKRKQDPSSKVPPKPPGDVEERFKLALRVLERGDPRKAEEEMLKAIRLEGRPNCLDAISLGGQFPHYYLPYYHLGRTQFFNGEYANALTSFSTSLEKRQVCVCGRELKQLHNLRKQCLEKTSQNAISLDARVGAGRWRREAPPSHHAPSPGTVNGVPLGAEQR